MFLFVLGVSAFLTVSMKMGKKRVAKVYVRMGAGGGGRRAAERGGRTTPLSQFSQLDS